MALLAIPLFMIACDEDDDERRNPTCPSSFFIQEESSGVKMADNEYSGSNIGCQGYVFTQVKTANHS